WGSRRATSSAPTMRSLAWPRSRSSAKTSWPPAISISSDTQRMPAISGSIHSSKYTRGRSGQPAEYSRICLTSSRMSSTSARAASGRRAVPGTPTTRSPAPSMNAISAVSAVRQTMRWGNSTPVLPYTGGSASVRRLQDFGERAVQQPVGERLRQGPWALDLDPPGPHTGGEARVAGVDAGQGAHVRGAHQAHLEAGIAHADVASRLLQHQPGRADLHAARG